MTRKSCFHKTLHNNTDDKAPALPSSNPARDGERPRCPATAITGHAKRTGRPGARENAGRFRSGRAAWPAGEALFPPLTEEKRKEIVKSIHSMCEDSKVAIRSIRRDCIDKLKKMEKASDITEDDLKDAEKDMQDKTDKFIKELDAVAAEKEKEIMEI